MRVLSETASMLTIHYPAWLGLACLAVGYALAGWLIRSARGSKSPVQHIVAGVGGLIIVSIVGFGALLDRVVLDAEGAREMRVLPGSQSVTWTSVAEVTLESRRSGRRGMQPHLVFRMARRGETAMEISGLAPEEIERVVAFATKRATGR